MRTAAVIVTLLNLAMQSLATPTVEKRWVVFDVSTEPNRQGIKKSYTVNRWSCQNFDKDGIDKQISWAFVDVGLAGGCTLFDQPNCKGASLNVQKSNQPILGPGAYNLANFNFDKRASSFSCY
ncbi:hypothetical protein K491DRAFT_187725 [Lophiostoma macrostomum CBS 122681]|uniref:Ecp2 effector protein domain-containing protein n=1 Tax=Lophiostoma macrostomum CBS 122681 TaxID=1314788 RepID=A0A6A6TT76_9PLEO|nr:hypothetical protein K491DRAFT_187725 [Lophiostoma macrostomum CBS 122681]